MIKRPFALHHSAESVTKSGSVCPVLPFLQDACSRLLQNATFPARSSIEHILPKVPCAFAQRTRLQALWRTPVLQSTTPLPRATSASATTLNVGGRTHQPCAPACQRVNFIYPRIVRDQIDGRPDGSSKLDRDEPKKERWQGRLRVTRVASGGCDGQAHLVRHIMEAYPWLNG